MLVSIITPYYKSERYIFNTVQSVLKQSLSSWELIIIDDENTFKSKIILKKIKRKSKKIKIIQNRKNLGVALSRNVGIQKSKGKYIAFLDSDDLWKKNKLEKQIKFMKKHNYFASYTSYKAVNIKNKTLYEVKSLPIINHKDLIKACNICCSSVILHRSLLANNKFRNLVTKEDYELWLRISKKNHFYGIPYFLTTLIVRDNSLSNKELNKIYNAFKIYNYFNGCSVVKSLVYVLRLYINSFQKKYL